MENTTGVQKCRHRFQVRQLVGHSRMLQILTHGSGGSRITVFAGMLWRICEYFSGYVIKARCWIGEISSWSAALLHNFWQLWFLGSVSNNSFKFLILPQISGSISITIFLMNMILLQNARIGHAFQKARNP